MIPPFDLSDAERRLLPGGRLRGPTLYVIAIMTFAMTVVAAAGLALANMAGMVDRSVDKRYVLLLPAGADNAQLSQVLKSIRAVPGVAGTEAVPEPEMRRTLQRWLGTGTLAAGLPVPALIHLEIAPAREPAAVARAAQARVPGSRLIQQEAVLQPLLRSLRTIQWLAIALVVLMAVAAAACVVLAARGALDTHQESVEILHGIGATDRQVARLFQHMIARDALIGAALGGVVAGLVLLLATGGAELSSALSGRPLIGPGDTFVLALIPLSAILLATVVARGAVLSALRKLL
jgi:cell division transport system permease protein